MKLESIEDTNKTYNVVSINPELICFPLIQRETIALCKPVNQESNRLSAALLVALKDTSVSFLQTFPKPKNTIPNPRDTVPNPTTMFCNSLYNK